jgi:hypothetical protein
VQAEPQEHLRVLFFLPSFPSSVLYSQPHMQLPQALDAQASQAAPATSGFTAIFDPEVARAALGQETNPCEIKALKLSQASGSAGVDRCRWPRAAPRLPPCSSIVLLGSQD